MVILRPFLDFSALFTYLKQQKKLIWPSKTEEIAFLKRNSDPSFADFLKWQILRVLAKMYFFHNIWCRLVCFCTLVNAKMTGQSENAIRFAISTIVWELESF